MRTVLEAVLAVFVLLAIFGCSSYTACEHRRNAKNYAATKMGYVLDSNASFWERNAAGRHANMSRFKKLPFYGNNTGYRGFVINMSEAQPVNYTIYDADGVEVGSGLLRSVFQEQQVDYRAQFVVDTLYIPFGTYKVAGKYLDGRTSAQSFYLPSPEDSPLGLKGHWHIAFR